MSSLIDLVKKANGLNTTKKDDFQEEDDGGSTLLDLAKKANSGTGKIKSTLTDEQVNSWFSGAADISKQGYAYLSADGYRKPNETVITSIDGYLKDADDIAVYIRANKDNIGDYDKTMQSYHDTVSYLRSLRDNIQSVGDHFSKWDTEEDYQTSLRYYGYQQKYNGKSYDDLQTALTELEDGEEKDWLSYYVSTLPEGLHPPSALNYHYDITDSYAAMPLPKGYHESETKPGYLIRDDNDDGDFMLWLSNVAGAGVNSFNTGITSTLDVLIGKPLQELGWEDNPISELDETYEELYDEYKTDLAFETERLGGGGWETASEIGEATVAAIPDMLLAMMTGGTSKAVTSGKLATQAAYEGGTILTKAGLTASQMAKNPQYWLSFARTYGSDYEEAIASGANPAIAALSATTSSLVNAGIEIGFTGGSGIQGLADGIGDGWANGIKALAISAVEEGGEEVLQRTVNDLVARVMYDEDRELASLEEYAKEFAMGTAVGLILGSGQTGIQSAVNHVGNGLNTYNYNKRTKGIYGSSVEGIQALVQEGLQSPEGSLSHKLATQYQEKLDKGKSLSGKEISQLIEANDQAIRVEETSEMRAATEAKLKELGETGDVSAIADVIIKKAYGEPITAQENAILKNSKHGSELVSAVAPDKQVNRVNAGKYEDALMNLAQEVASGKSTPNAYQATKSNLTAVTDNASQVDHKVSEDGKMENTITGDVIEPQGLVQAENGTYKIAAKDADPVSSADVSYADSNQALVYETFVNLEKHSGKTSKVIADMDLASRNELLGLYNPNINKNAGTFVNGVLDAYFYGHRNVDLSAVGKDSPVYTLTEQQRRIAWNTGRKAGIKSDTAVQSNLDTVYAEATKVLEQTGKSKNGNYRAVLADGIVAEDMSDAQYATYQLADKVAQAVQTKIRVYKGKNKAQGFYNHATDEIWLNLNAANRGREAIMAFTLAHELVHRAKKGSLAKYQAFVDFLLKEYGKQGSNVEAMIAEQIRAAEEFNKTVPDDEKVNMTREKALEEVVCDACQRMFLDTNAGEKLAEFGAQSKQNKGFLADLKKWISELMTKLRRYFGNVDPDSLAAKEFAKFDAKVKQMLADMYVDMSIEAGEKLSTINAAGMLKNTTQEDGASYSIKNTKDMSWSEQINGALYGEGNIRRNDTLVVGSSVNTSVGNEISNKPLAIPLSILTKAITGKDISHSIKRGKLAKLDAGIRNAPITIVNPSRNAIVYVTDIKQGGLPIVVAFDMNTTFDGDDVHKATSIHLHVDVDAMLKNLPESATVYIKKDESDPVGATNNLRGLAAKIKLIEKTIPQESKFVKKNPLSDDGEYSPSTERQVDFADREAGQEGKSFSLPKTDSAGNNLSEAQQEFFKDSKAVDENGNLAVLYHGTKNGGFTVFDPSISDDSSSLFFTDDPVTASTYAADSLAEVTDTPDSVPIPKVKPKMLRPFERNATKGKGKSGAYKVYLNLTNPLVVEANGANWNNIPFNGSNPVSVTATVNGDTVTASIERAGTDSPHTVTFTKADIENGNFRAYFANEFNDRMAGFIQKRAEQQVKKGDGNYPLRSFGWDADNKKVATYGTRSIAQIAKEQSYDGVIFKGLYDSNLSNDRTGKAPNIYIAFNSNQVKDVNNTNPTADKDIRYSLPKMGEKKSPTTLTEHDLRDLLQKAKNGEMDDGTYFPVRINTPDVLLDAILTVAKKKGITNEAELKKLTADRPVAIQVFKARQSLATEENWGENGRPHNLSIDDIVAIVKKMDDPQYIVYEGSTGRYVEILKYHTERGDDAFAVVELENFKDEPYLNGYASEMYNILVTLYQPDAKKRVTNLLNGKDNIVIHPQKKKGNSQVTSGIHVPSVLNKSPFAPTVPQEKNGVKTESNQDNKLPIGEDTSPRALLANAFEGIITDDIEKRKIQEYKDKVEMLNAEEQKLHELRAEIKELSFAKGKRDTKRIKDLQFEAIHTANCIATLDKTLLRLEAAAPLQSILKREKEMAYKRAEQKGKEALEAYKKAERERDKQWQSEVKEKYQASKKKAIETRDKREAREKLQKVVLDTVKWITYPSKTDVKCPDILKQPYADFLNGIDLSSQRLAKGGDPTQSDLRLANAMSSLATALDRVMASQDPNQDTTAVLDTGYLDLPAHFVQKLRDMTEEVKAMMGNSEYVVNRMPAEDVRKLTQMIRTLNHAIKEVSTLYANLRFANVEALGDNTMSFVDALGEIDKTGGVKDFVQWDNALPYYAFKRFGEGGESIFEGLMDAQDKLAFLAQDIFNFREKAWTSKEAKAWSEDTHKIDLPNGTSLTLTTADAMSIYCLSRRQQGLQHLLGGGTRVMGIQKGSQKAKDSRSLLTIKDIETIISSLTDRQKQVADAIQEFMSTTCSEWGNEISMKRFLTKEFNEKFYFPIESNDENLATKDPSAQQSDLFRLLNISATKPIDPRANNEVIIRNIFDVFTNHASDMARLNAYGMPLLDYMKWLNYREKTVNEEGQIKVRGVRKSMELAYGNAAKSYVLNLVKDVNGRASDGGDPNIWMKWMRNAKTASVGNSLRVATLQLTSFPRAALVISPKNLALGLTKMPQIAKAKKYCGIALWKSFGFYDTNISRSIEDQIKGVTNVRQKLIELSLKGAEWGDAITWGCLWNACEYEVAATKQYKVGTEEFNLAVGKKLREVVYATQVVDSTLTRSQIMRSKRGMAQEAAAFMSEPTLSANILMDAAFQFNAEKRKAGSIKTALKKTGKYISRAFAVYSIGQLAAALVEGLWDAWRDDDDEEFGEKYLNAFVENLTLDLIPFNKIPIVSDVVEAALSMFDIGFYSSDKMSTTWLTQAVSAVDAWKEVLNGGSSMTAYNALYKSLRAVSSFYGVSFSGVMREGVALWNNTAGSYDSTLKIRTWDLSKTDLASEALDAIIEENDRQASSIRAEFPDDDSYQSAMRTAIKDRYTSGEIDYDTAIQYLVEHGGMEEEDAYWKAEEWMHESETGEDFGKYNEFFTAVQTGKNLKSVIKKYTDNGVELTTLSTQISNYFKPLYIEMSRSEKAGIKGYLLNAFEQCGVKREDAAKKLQYWEFISDYPDSDLTQSRVAGYYEFAKPAGISAKLYVNYCDKVKDIEGEGKKERRMAIIHSLPISKIQKDALYFAEGWAKSKLHEAPWHK